MIRYFTEDTAFRYIGKRFNNKWLKSVISLESKDQGDINIIFCSDDYLLEVNKKFLGHDYYTDIITFDYCQGDLISGDLFISVDSVKDNAEHFSVQFDEELHRVIVHGVLHLIGYDDHQEDDIRQMREKENYYLELRKNLNE